MTDDLRPVVRPNADLVFDPRRSSSLVVRGIRRLEAAEGTPTSEGERAAGPGRLPTGSADRLLAHFATQLGASMLANPDPLDRRQRAAFTPEQGTLALCCLYVCANAPAPPSPFAMLRLGAVTDLVADEARYWWWNALALQVALNVGGEGNGGYRALHGNLVHPQDDVRRELFRIAWLARRHLDWRRAAPPLLANVELSLAHWPASLAILRAACADESCFREAAEGYRPERYPTRFRGRIAGALDPNGALGRYLLQPDDLTAAEDAIRRRVEARLLGA